MKPERIFGPTQGLHRSNVKVFPSTANFPEHVVEQLPEEITTGIYFGWARVDNGPTFKMVMSIGWNPYYKNERKSMVGALGIPKYHTECELHLRSRMSYKKQVARYCHR